MLKLLLVLVISFLIFSLGASESKELLDVHLEDAASCTMCQTALGKFMTNPVSASLANSCDSYASNAAAFTSCRFVWVTRYDKVTNLAKNGCQNKYGQTIKPCPVQAVCNSLIMYPGAGKLVNYNNRYCNAPADFNQYPAIPPILTEETTPDTTITTTTTLRKRE